MGRCIPAAVHMFAIGAFVSAIGQMDVPELQAPCLKIGFLLILLGFVAEERVKKPSEEGAFAWLLQAAHWLIGVGGITVFYSECGLGRFCLGVPLLGMALAIFRIRRSFYPVPWREPIAYRGKRVWEIREQEKKAVILVGMIPEEPIDWHAWTKVLERKSLPKVKPLTSRREQEIAVIAAGIQEVFPTPEYSLAFEMIEVEMV